ncbi:heat shock factor protein 5 [Betta splendens]|uniref:Heat shock factor protein 5 n=1 Tax=Betta splendens TaxID=158456 RepID=A0A6P7PER8_BETSP|nr:heat shock factor protein 5 [Betta splendens]
MDPLPLCINPNHFPAKLWRLINNPDIDSIFWDRFGELIVIDKHLFQEEILSPGAAGLDCFKTTNFSSFIRQLNLYGFKKIRNVEDHHYYQYFVNPNFKRDQPELVAKLWRLTVENKAKVQAGLSLERPGPSGAGGGAEGGPDARSSPVPVRFMQSDQGAELCPFLPALKVIPALINELSPEATSTEKKLLADKGNPYLLSFNPYNAQYPPNFYYPVSPCFHPNLVTGSEHQTWLFSPQTYYQKLPSESCNL